MISAKLLEPYVQQQERLPKAGQYIIGQFTDDDIIVYQVFNHKIASYAVQNQKFGGDHYSFSRMSWIKPGFMWMMYRSSWAQKENQECILSIRIRMSGFLEILRNATHSSYKSSIYPNREDWQADLKTLKIRLQWDPDHKPKGMNLDRKAIQLGMKDDILKKFNAEWILEINDITDFVMVQRSNAYGLNKELIVPLENVLVIEDISLRKRLGLTFSDDSRV